MAAGETVLWTGTAAPAAEAAQAAGGRQQFTTLWKSAKKAAVTLTTQRPVYDIRKFTEGDMSWIVGGATGVALTALSAIRASAGRSGSSDKPLLGLPPPYGPAPRKVSPLVSATERFGIGPRTPSPI